MMKRVLMLLACAGLLPLAALAEVPDDAASQATDALMRAEMDRAHIPGAAVAVLRDGKLVKLSTYGIANLETGAAVGKDTRFQIASTTKLFTSVLLMDLVDEGRIGLDDPVGKFLPQAPASWADITVGQLASHASGMARVPPDPTIGSVDDAVAAAMKLPLATRPGQTNAYGSDDFAVLTAILERAGGMPFQPLLESRVLQPLGLAHTRFDNARLDPPHIVLSYDELPARAGTYEWKDGRQQRYVFLYPTYTYAAGGLFSTITDMAAFVGGVLDGRLFGAEAMERMWQPVVLADGKPGTFATGWTVGREHGRRKVGHSGGPALGDVAVYPEQKLAVIVLTNQRKLYPTLAQDVARLYLPANDFKGLPAIADSNPALTAAHMKLVSALMRGQAAAASFAPSVQGDVAQINEWLQLRTGSLPPADRLELVKDAANSRTYRSVHAQGRTLLWRIDADADGKVADVEASEE